MNGIHGTEISTSINICAEYFAGRQLDVGGCHGRARSTTLEWLPDIGFRRRLEVD